MPGESKFYPWTLKHFDPEKVPLDLDLRPYIEDKKTDVLQKIKNIHNIKNLNNRIL